MAPSTPIILFRSDGPTGGRGEALAAQPSLPKVDRYTKKPDRCSRVRCLNGSLRLTLGELRSTSSAVKAGLLAFLHTGIASQKSAITKDLKHFAVVADQGTGQTHAARAGLTGCSTTANGNQDVQAVGAFNGLERFDNGLSILDVRKEFLDGLAINGDLPGALAKSDASDG